MQNRILTGIIIALSIILFYVGCRLEQEKKAHTHAQQTADETKRRLSGIVNPIAEYKDKDGHTHLVLDDSKSVFPSAETKVNNPNVIDSVRPFVNQVAEALDIKASQVQSALAVSASVNYDSVAFLNRKIDSLKGVIKSVKQTYHNQYLELTTTTGNLSDSSDKGTFDYHYNIDLFVFQYWKRKKFLWMPIGERQSFTDISTTDSNATIKGVRKYTVVQKRPEMGFRLSGFTSYNVGRNNFTSGIRMSYDIKGLNLNYAKYYDFGLKHLNNSVGLSYDFIR